MSMKFAFNRLYSYRLLLLIMAVILVIPFVVVTYPPCTDLPQHLAQITLLKQAVHDHTGTLTVQWIAPNVLVYYLMLGLSFIFPPVPAGNAIMVLMVLLWITAIYWLVKNRQRPPEVIILCSVFIFSANLYWGYLNFMTGWPLFVLWLLLAFHPAGIKNWILTAAVSFILFSGHALWLIMAGIWLIPYLLSQRTDLKTWVLKISTLIPVALFSLVWFPRFVSSRDTSGFDTAAHWLLPPLQRLNPVMLRHAMLGGLRGPAETVTGLIIALWIILSLATKRHRLKQEIDFPLLIASGLMILSFPDTSRQMHQYHRFRPARAPVRHDHAGYIPARPPYQHPAALASSSHIHRFFLPGDDDPVDTFRPG